MPELPHTCACGQLTMVDYSALERRQATKIETIYGYSCACGTWNAVFVSTISLNESMKRLERMRPERIDFRFHFLKTLKKAQGIRQRTLNGAI